MAHYHHTPNDHGFNEAIGLILGFIGGIISILAENEWFMHLITAAGCALVGLLIQVFGRYLLKKYLPWLFEK